MHNLVPAVGELNGRRSNLPMGIVDGEPRVFGACDAEIGDGRFEPRPAFRGDVARAYLYMNAAYPALEVLSAAEVSAMLRWSRADPPDPWERERNRRIETQQGNSNPFIARFGESDGFGCR